MKKTYVKPQLWKEAFQPADAIAGGCTVDVHFGEYNCKYWSDHYNKNLFVMENDACNMAWEDGDDKGCYHIPNESLGYFGS